MSAASAYEKTARMLSALGAAGPPSGLEDLSWTWRNEERAGAARDWVLLQRFAAVRA